MNKDVPPLDAFVDKLDHWTHRMAQGQTDEHRTQQTDNNQGRGSTQPPGELVLSSESGTAVVNRFDRCHGHSLPRRHGRA